MKGQCLNDSRFTTPPTYPPWLSLMKLDTVSVQWSDIFTGQLRLNGDRRILISWTHIHIMYHLYPACISKINTNSGSWHVHHVITSTNQSWEFFPTDQLETSISSTRDSYTLLFKQSISKAVSLDHSLIEFTNYL